MSLAPGARLGGYEVVGLIGAGGMGEVYRARDTKLRRDVAIKLVTAAFCGDVRDQLHREARAAAASIIPTSARFMKSPTTAINASSPWSMWRAGSCRR